MTIKWRGAINKHMFLFRKQEQQTKQQIFVDYSKLSQEEIKKLEEELIQISNKYLNNPDWQQFYDGYSKMYSLSYEGRVATKGQMTLDFSVQTIVQFLKDPQSFKKTDVMMEDVKVLQKGNQYQIAYIKFKGMWPVASRDLIIYGIRKQVGDTFYLLSKSIPYKYQSQSGVVRAQCHIGAYILKRLSPTTTKVIYISDADVKGMIPGFIKTMVSKMQASVPKNLSRILTGKLKNTPEKEQNNT